MFTTGSKLFLGATVLSVVAAVVYGLANGGSRGWLGTIGLLTAAIAFAFLFGINYYTRDGNVKAMSNDSASGAPAASPPPGRSMWPAMAAIAVATTAIGAETKPVVFKVGIVLLLASAAEWMIQGWSERASADAAYNAGLRKRILHPLEFPVLAFGGLATLIYAFSRIMLTIDKANGPVVFIVAGALVLIGGFLIASRPSLKKGMITGVCAVAALGLVGTGVAMAVSGQRTIEDHPTTSQNSGAACSLVDDGGDAELDDRASQAVASKASIGINLVLQDGILTAHELGVTGDTKVVTVSRGNIVNVIFTNRDSEKRRLTVNMGEFEKDVNGTKVKEQPKACTNLVRTDGSQFLSFVLREPSIASGKPYTFSVPGVAKAEIEIKVP
jgi:hypothetical protein